MKPFMGYIILAIGIATGIAANSLGKISDGFTKLTPTIACLILISLKMFYIYKSIKFIKL
jgi:small multidrug resistance pump